MIVLLLLPLILVVEEKEEKAGRVCEEKCLIIGSEKALSHMLISVIYR